MCFHFYVKDCAEQEGGNRQLSDADGIEVWQPSWRKILPPHLPWYPFLAFWLFHQLRVFKNRNYRVLFIKDGDRVIQRCCVLPAFFRYPFMHRDDLTVGTWTHPDYRRRGLAARTLAKAMRVPSQPFRRIWYITNETNAASVRLAERCEFVFFGTGKRVTTFGSGILGRFRLETLHPTTCSSTLPSFLERSRDRA